MCQLGVSYKVAIYLPCPFYTKLASTVYSPSHSTMLRFDEISSNIDIFLRIVFSIEKCPTIIVSASFYSIEGKLLSRLPYYTIITCGLYIFNPPFSRAGYYGSHTVYEIFYILHHKKKYCCKHYSQKYVTESIKSFTQNCKVQLSLVTTKS